MIVLIIDFELCIVLRTVLNVTGTCHEFGRTDGDTSNGSSIDYDWLDCTLDISRNNPTTEEGLAPAESGIEVGPTSFQSTRSTLLITSSIGSNCGIVSGIRNGALDACMPFTLMLL
jgi:hypothetical protein